MSSENSKFYLWWNSYEVKRKVGAAYSIGAAVVIIGAMFKILHLPFAGEMLGVGMTVEAILFSLGVFDKPHKDMDWDKVFDIEAGPINNFGSALGGKSTNAPAQKIDYTESISDDDVKKLSEGIKNLSQTATQLSSISQVAGATETFAKNIDEANQITGKFIKTQESLNGAAGLLTSSYQGISEGMTNVEKSTQLYAGKVDGINKNLSSINSIYEIQLKNIQAQSEGLTQQNERIKDVYQELDVIFGEIQRMKASATIAAQETENYKSNTIKLAKQVESLNQVYGNMLNALS